MIAASYQEALVTFRDLLDDGVDASQYSEYVRGGVNLIADLFPVYQMDVGTRMEQVLADLKRIPMHADPAKLTEHGVFYDFMLYD
jgi:hypothetical protein